jgi:hypothetical protein
MQILVRCFFPAALPAAGALNQEGNYYHNLPSKGKRKRALAEFLPLPSAIFAEKAGEEIRSTMLPLSQVQGTALSRQSFAAR